MAIVIVFVLGIVNFAAHRAVLESGHPLVDSLPRALRNFGELLGGRVSFVVEFAMLLGAMWMVSVGSTGWALAYICYSALNGLAAWLILTDRT